MHAVVTNIPVGDHLVEVQYKTQRGAEIWYDKAFGSQFRSISIVEI